MYINKISALTLSVSMFLAGCAAPVATHIQPSPASVAHYGKMSDIDIVAALEKNVNDARASDMPFLAPNYFKAAAQLLSDTRNQLGNQPGTVLAKNAARGDAILDKGRAMMGIVKYRFAKELELKSRLDQLGAQKLLPADYQRTMASFSRLVEKVEREQKGNIDHEQDAVLISLQQLEVHTVQEGALHEAEAINAATRKQHADQQAPLTYNKALAILAEAKKRIAKAPRDAKLAQDQGELALFAARRARQVNDRVAQLMGELKLSGAGSHSVGVSAGASAPVTAAGQSGTAPRAPEKLTLEKLVLKEADGVQAIATALGLGDLRDQPLDKQLAAIRQTAAQLALQGKGKVRRDYETRLKAAEDAERRAKAQLAEQGAEMKVLKAKLEQLQRKAAKPSTRHHRRAAKHPAKRRSPTVAK